MQNQIHILKELQLNDNRINDLTRKTNTYKQEIENLKNEFEGKKKDFANKEEERKEILKKKHQLELDVDSIDNKVVKLKEQQFAIKTNKEYSLLLQQVDEYNENKSNLEDDILTQMEMLEEIERYLKKLKLEMEEDEKILEKDIKEKEIEINLAQKEVDELLKRKETLLDSLKQDFKASYITASKKYRGEAVVEIKQKICQGCFMTLPPQIVNEVLMGEKVIICENCGRILVNNFILEEVES